VENNKFIPIIPFFQFLSRSTEWRGKLMGKRRELSVVFLLLKIVFEANKGGRRLGVMGRRRV
jgi:hypothetical protein